MTENKQQSIESIYESLSPDEEEAVISLCITEWQSGIADHHFRAFEISPETVQSLVKRSVITQKTTAEFAQEFIDEHQAEVDRIRANYNPLNDTRTEKDRMLLDGFSNRKQLLSYESSFTEPRYRLYSKEFHDYAHAKLNEEE